MAESKMKEVAQLLGVELGEEFKIKGINGTYKFTNKGLFSSNSVEVVFKLNGLLKGGYGIEKPILDKVEKRYLENLLRPFKDKDIYVEKRESSNKQYVYICIDGESVYLPYFEKDTMYKGMEVKKKYTLKELWLFE